MSSTTFDPEALLAHTQWLRRFAGSLVRDLDVAEDLTQDAMLAALRNPPDSGWAIQSWLRKVVQRGAVQARREKQRRDRRELVAARSEEAESTVDVLEQVDMQRSVVSAMLELDDIYSKTLALRFFEDLSYEEIGKKMEVSIETVRTRIRRGLSKLRKRMDREFGERRAWAAPLLGIDPSSIELPPALPLGPTLAALAAAALLSLFIVDPLDLLGEDAPQVAEAPVEVVVVRWPFLCRLSDPASILSKTVAAEFAGQVRVSEENYANSTLARREGLIRYPAVFVDGELFAGPTDFHAWDVMRGGLYQPWADVASRQRFSDDLRMAIESQLQKTDRAAAAAQGEEPLRSGSKTLTEAAPPKNALADPANLVAMRIQKLREDFIDRRGVLTAGLERELDKLESAALEGEWLGSLYAMSEHLIQLEEILAEPSLGRPMQQKA
ncbi:MAG: RNA polymerase sigma factor, partial [Planctomycetota bacterium]